MRVLVACEYSGRVRDAFTALGHHAMSCDLLPTDAPGRHHQGDIFDVIDDGWDLMIAHPPCTYLTNAGVRWLYSPDKTRNEPRWVDLASGAAFFKRLLDAPIPKIVVENPIPHSYAIALIGRTYDQLVQPWQFGHKANKATCFWLKGLPKLEPTNVVGPMPRDVADEERRVWNAIHLAPPGPNRWKMRSTTFLGIAAAMASQLGATS
jgi:hypothetical protein